MYRLATHRIPSDLLRDNPLGDPAERDVHVLTPPGYDPLRRYPAVWLLGGFSSHPAMITASADPWTEGLVARLQRLYSTGAIGQLVVVVPDAFTAYGGSQYLDSSAFGPYESHLWKEVLPVVESRYPSSRRAIAGKSSGGYGAIVQAMRHPDIFDAVACHSGDMGFEYCYLPGFPESQREIERHGGVRKFFQAFCASPQKRAKRWNTTLNTIAMAAAYSPNPEAADALGIDLPFDLATGELRDDVWTRWLAWDPVRMVDGHAAALAGMRLVHVDCGRKDEYFLDIGARILSAKMKKLGIAHDHEEFDDGHSNVTYRYDVSLAKIWKALSAG